MTKLYKHQKEDVAALESLDGRSLLASEMGVGKTVSVLTYLKRHPELRPAIIVCPATLKWVWEAQAKQHCNLRTTILSGRKTPKMGLRNEKEIFILNYDILDAWKEYLIGLKAKIVVYDEAHNAKSPSAKKTKALKAICKGIPHVIAISGTPLTNRPAELFSTLNILWPKEFPSFTQFAHKHCAPKWKPWGWDFRGASHLPELHSKLKRLGMIRRLKKDILKDLPTKTRIIVPIDIQNRSEYKKALTDFINWLGAISPAKAKRASKAEEIVKIGYLVRLAAELKMKSVFEWIDNFFEESDDKLIVFACHKMIIQMLRERYKGICVGITGTTSQKDRKIAVQNFQKNPKTKLFVGNIRAAGVGIDLYAASTVAFVETGWVGEEVIQAEDRSHRIGQTKNVVVYYLISKDTIEEDLCRILQNKHDIVTKILDGKNARKESRLSVHDQLIKILGKDK